MLWSEDIPDARQKFIEVVGAAVGAFEAFVIHHKPFDHVFPQVAVGPYTKLRAALASHPEPYGQNHVKGVKGNFVLLAVGGSC